MKNKIFTITLLTSPKSYKHYFSSIASIFMTQQLSIMDIIKKINKSKLYSTLNLVFISKNPNINGIKSENLGVCNLTIVPYLTFFSEEYINDNIINSNLENNIYIFEHETYKQICLNFALNNLIISGGSNTKKHILSPIQLKLSIFLFIAELSNDISLSFKLYDKNYIQSRINHQSEIKKISSQNFDKNKIIKGLFYKNNPYFYK